MKFPLRFPPLPSALLLAFLFSLPAVIQRFNVESKDKQILLLIDHRSYFRLAILKGLTLSDYLKDIQPLGVLVLEEETFEDLLQRGDLTIQPEGSTLRISSTSQQTLNRAGQALTLHFPGSVSVTPERNAYRFQGTYEDLRKTGALFDPELLEQLKEYPIPFLLRPRNPTYITTEILYGILGYTLMHSDIPLLLSGGDEALGYPRSLPEVAQKWNGYIAAVEFSEQKGLDSLIISAPDKAVRVHSISDKELPRYTPDKALARYVRAVKERKVRILYLRPLTGLTYSENLTFLHTLRQKLSSLGYPTGDFTSEDIHISLLYYLLTLMGLFLILWFAVHEFPWRGDVKAAAFSLILLSFFIALGGRTSLTYKLPFFLLSSTLIPVAFLHESWKNGKLNWLRLTTMNYLLGFILSSFLLDTSLLRGVIPSPGVKLSILLPLVLVAFYFFSGGYSLRALQSTAISLWDMGWILMAMGAVGILLLRSGNISGVVLPGEEAVRNFLETYLPARPRFKELFTHPIFILLGAFPRQEKNLLWAMAGTLGFVGQVSIVNAFLHLHTPLVLTLQRALLGMIFGGLAGWLILQGVLLYERASGRVFWRR